MRLIEIHMKIAEAYNRVWRTKFFRPRAEVLFFRQSMRKKYQSNYDYWQAVGHIERRAYLKARGKLFTRKR